MYMNFKKTVSVLAITTSLTLVACSEAETPLNTNPYRAQGVIAGTLPEIIASLDAGEVTSEQLVGLYLKRIASMNTSGPELRAVLSINPNLVKEAIAADKLRREGSVLGPLHGVPILLKDNIETKDDLPTTAGSYALKDNYTGRDSPLVAGLRAQGAIILGKSNLSQWANFRSESSNSGWSALGGQVKNPHVMDRSPCGSSSGSGAGMAASFAAATVGTETDGSVICPSSVNGIVGFKPTVGLVPQDYIVPISVSQDTAGPMTKSVEGAAIMMDAMTQGRGNFVAALSASSLKGVRLGVLRVDVGEDAEVAALYDAAIKNLEAAGATIVEVGQADMLQSFGEFSYDLLQYEFKDGLNSYLASTPKAVTARTLSDLIKFNKAYEEIELKVFDQSIFVKSNKKGPLTDQAYIDGKVSTQSDARAGVIDKLLSEYDLGALVSLFGAYGPLVTPGEGENWENYPSMGSVAAIAGYPHITVPMGTVNDFPFGLSLIGTAGSDETIVSYGYAYEQRSQKRAKPAYKRTIE